MKIARRVPEPIPPQTEITMTFPLSEGWAISMALRDAYDRYPGAVERDRWKQWAADLDSELRR